MLLYFYLVGTPGATNRHYFVRKLLSAIYKFSFSHSFSEGDVSNGGHQPPTQHHQDVTSSSQGGATAGEGQTAAAPLPSSPAQDESEQPAEVPEAITTPSSLADDTQQATVTSPTLLPDDDQEATETSSKTLIDDVKQTAVTSTTSLAEDVQRTTVTVSSSLADDVQTRTLTSPPASLRAEDVLRATVTSSSLQTEATEPTNNTPETPLVETDESEKMADTQVQVQAASPPPGQQQQQQQQQQSVVQEPAKTEEKAVCKYRWGKVVPTNCQRVIFFCSAHPVSFFNT